MPEKKKGRSDREIVPGMRVEATEGDLGEQDVSPAKVKDVVKNPQGEVEGIRVSKGVVFKKELDVPADRIQAVNPVAESGESNGTVTIDAQEGELALLHGLASQGRN